MYKHLAYLETDISKILAILGKRRGKNIISLC